MKSLGIVRRIDKLGRLVLPKEVRRTKGWESDTPLEMFATEDGLFIKEYGVDKDKALLIQQLEGLKARTDNLAAKEIYENTIKLVREGQ